MSFELKPFDLPVDYGAQIVPLADVKAHMHVLDNERDDLISFCRDAAVDMVEKYCGVRLGPCTGLEWISETLRARVDLGVWPVTGLTSVSWLDSTGVTVTGDISQWRIAVRDRLLLKPGQTLPGTVSGGVMIAFDAGFTDANRPPALVQAVKMFTAHLFLHPEAVGSGSIGGEIPLGFRFACRQYRMPVI